MKTSSDELHRLIRSLTKTEKKYFRSFASRHVLGDKNNYLLLYEVIEKQEHYNEEEVKKLLKGHKLLSYFSTAKNHLYNLLLDSLYAFRANTDPEIMNRKKLQHAAILFEKGFIRESLKALQKLKKKAMEEERFTLLLDALSVEKNIIARKYYKNVATGQLSEIHGHERKVLEVMNNQNDYWYLHGSMYMYHFSKGSARREHELDHLSAIMGDRLMTDENNALSFRARLDYLQTHAIYQFAQGKPEEAYRFNKRFLALLEDNREKMNEYPKRYLAALNNYLVDSLNLKKFTELEEGLVKLRALPGNDVFRQIERVEADVFRLSYILELNVCIATGNFGKAYLLKEQVEKGLADYDASIVHHNKLTLYYLMAYTCFGMEKYSESLKWVNRILNDTSDDIVQDIQASARILNLLIHFELKNYDLLEYAVRSTERYLRTRQQLHKLERTIIAFLRSAMSTATKTGMKDIYTNLKAELLALKADTSESRAFGYFDFISWADGKITRKSFPEAVALQA